MALMPANFKIDIILDFHKPMKVTFISLFDPEGTYSSQNKIKWYIISLTLKYLDQEDVLVNLTKIQKMYTGKCISCHLSVPSNFSIVCIYDVCQL